MLNIIQKNNESKVERKYGGIQYVPKLSTNIARAFRTTVSDPTIAPKPTKKHKIMFSNMKARTCIEGHYLEHTKRNLRIRKHSNMRVTIKIDMKISW